MQDHSNIGKAYSAWAAFNHNAKKNRISFDLERWLRVVAVLEKPQLVAGLQPKRKRKWSAEQKKKFSATMRAKAKAKANGAAHA